MNEKLDRRTFLRYGLLTGLAAVAAGALFRRGGASLEQSSACTGVCASCPLLAECKPQAVETPAWHETSRFSAGEETARDVAVGPDDQIYVAVDKKAKRFNPQGNLSGMWGHDVPVHCVTVAPDQTLYIGGKNWIRRPGGFRHLAGIWELSIPRTWLSGLAVTKDMLFAADAGNRKILSFDLDGNERGTFGNFTIPSPYFNVRIHPDGNLRINNTGKHRIETWTTDGKFVSSWSDNFPGCCNPSNIAIMPDGRIVTCEKGMPRVKVYSAEGKFESLVAGPNAFSEKAGLSAAVDSRGRIIILEHATGTVRIFEPKV